MAKFVFVYHGGKKPETQEEIDKVMADWGKWYQEIGDKLIDGGNPFNAGGQAVKKDGVTAVSESEHLSGYTIVEADDMNGAVEVAKACPMHKHTDGKAVVRVYEAMPM